MLNATDKLTHHWIGTTEGMSEIFPEWEALFESCIKPDPFLHPRWAKVWWSHFATSAELCLLCIRKNGALVGIAPLMYQKVYWRFLPIGEIRGFNNGQSVRPGLLLTAQPDELITLVIENLLENSGRQWNVLRLNGLDKSQTKALLDASESNSRLRVIESKHFFHSYLSLEGNLPEYLSKKSAKFRKSLRYADNLLERQGNVHLRMHEHQQELHEAIELFLELDSRSWKRENGEWLLNDRNLANYYYALIDEFAEISACGIYLLYLDDQIIGGVLCLFMHNIIYTLKTSFDHEYAKFSPGTVLFHHLIEFAFTANYSAIDFVGKMPFSDQWTKNNQCFQDVMLMNTKPYSLMLAGVRKIKQLSSYN